MRVTPKAAAFDLIKLIFLRITEDNEERSDHVL